MKKFAAFLSVIALTFVVCAEQATITTNAVSIPAPTQYGKMWTASVKNTGTETVYVRPNITTASLVITNAIPIAEGDAYTFFVGGVGKAPARTIGNIVAATTNGTTTINVAFE